MTVIAAITDGTRIIMAADTTSHLGGSIIHGARKIRRLASDSREEILIGVAGQGALIALISRMPVGPLPPITAPTSELTAWAERGAAQISALAMDAKPAVNEDGFVAATILLGMRGHLWLIAQQSASLVAGPSTSNFPKAWAIGSGSDIAKGYIAGAHHPTVAQREEDPDDVEVLEEAIAVACLHDDGCHLGPDRKPQIEILR